VARALDVVNHEAHREHKGVSPGAFDAALTVNVTRSTQPTAFLD
jgi:hypothetical protein